MKTFKFNFEKILSFLLIVLTMAGLVSCSDVNYSIITEDNMEQNIFEFKLEISNNQDVIIPQVFLSSSYEFVSSDGEETFVTFKDYIGMSEFDMMENLSTIPAIVQTDQMQITLSNTITYIDAKIYDSDGTIIGGWHPWEEYSSLDEGHYFIILQIHNEINDFYVNAQCLFILYLT